MEAEKEGSGVNGAKVVGLVMALGSQREKKSLKVIQPWIRQYTIDPFCAVERQGRAQHSYGASLVGRSRDKYDRPQV